MGNRVTITIDFMVDDETELECFFGDAPEDIQGQADTMIDWLREAPYNYSIDYKIRQGFHGVELVGREYSMQNLKSLISKKQLQARKLAGKIFSF